MNQDRSQLNPERRTAHAIENYPAHPGPDWTRAVPWRHLDARELNRLVQTSQSRTTPPNPTLTPSQLNVNSTPPHPAAAAGWSPAELRRRHGPAVRQP
jgi:hypothetical protein